MAKEEQILKVLQRVVPETPTERLVPDERPVKIVGADALVLGMGRVGVGVYRRLTEEYGLNVYGIDFDEDRIERLRRLGYNIISGDVTDTELWRRIELEQRPKLYVLALPGHRDSVDMVENIRRYDTSGVIASTTKVLKFKDVLVDGGADVAVYLYDGAGEELADQAMEVVAERA